MFFPGKGQVPLGNQAAMICMECPVFRNCQSYRNQTGDKYGIWAGRWYGRND